MCSSNDFTKMKKGFDLDQAITEANKCLLCYDAPCSKACPAATNPGEFIRKLRFKNITGAIRTIKENNILGGACGILCPSKRLCEKECSYTEIEKPVQIAKIQRFLIEHSWKINFSPFEKKFLDKEKVAVIGSGPAGLSCAAELAKDGYQVSVFEEKDKPGGVLRYGVPEYRFSKDFMDKEINDLKNLGVEFKLNAPIQGQSAIENLLTKGFEAVFIGTGVWNAIRFDNKNIKEVLSCTFFLEEIRKENFEIINNHIKDKQVAVIGGGSVAIDCAETAFKFGAKDVYLVYRRSYNQMPAEQDELLDAQKQGIHFLLLNQPVSYLSDEKENLTGIKLRRTKLAEPDSSGRRSPQEIPDSEWVLNIDTVIEAIGSKPFDESNTWYPNVKLTDKKLVITDKDTGATSVNGIFAGGDIVRGPALIVQAIEDGKKAAKAINNYLRKQGK